jgi:hypothetical protein
LPKRQVYDAGSSCPATRQKSACENAALELAAVLSRRSRRQPEGAVIDCVPWRPNETTASCASPGRTAAGRVSLNVDEDEVLFAWVAPRRNGAACASCAPSAAAAISPARAA